ncbi:MAG: hypothetical protein CMP11_05500 [Zetaproteobacteria bacterium]|nr:hypothetical protein [Pseudobdellovibrionaceae bacterium]
MESFMRNASKKMFWSLTLSLFFCSAAVSFAKDKAYTINGKSTPVADLLKDNQGLFYDLELKKYQQIEMIAQEAYLKDYFEQLAKKSGTSAEAAQMKYLEDNVKVDDKEVKETVERFKSHPRFKDLTEKEMKEQVVQLLKGRSSKVAIDSLLAQATKTGKLVINYPKPIEPRYNVAITKDDHVRYGADATATTPIKCAGNDCPIRIVEYSEFQCPFCSRVIPTSQKILKEYEGQVAWVTRDFPLNFHDRAVPSAVAAKCSSFQGKYWQMYHKLFDNQRNLSDDDFKKYGKEIGLDMKSFEACLASPEKAKKLIDANFASGQQNGITGTPGYFINGRRLSGALPYEEFEKIIIEELAQKNVAKKKNSK